LIVRLRDYSHLLSNTHEDVRDFDHVPDAIFDSET